MTTLNKPGAFICALFNEPASDTKVYRPLHDGNERLIFTMHQDNEDRIMDVLQPP
jgi:hypothetical protein